MKKNESVDLRPSKKAEPIISPEVIDLADDQKQVDWHYDECVDIMRTAKSVDDWNALRELVQINYIRKEFGDNKRQPILTELMIEIDSKGLIVEVLGRDDKSNYTNVVPVNLN